MAKDVNPLETMGERTARALRAYSVERGQAIERARRGYLEAALGKTAPRPRARLWPPLLAGAVAAALLVVFVTFRAPRPLAFTADGAPATVQTWLAAPEKQPLSVQFSDGTALRVEAASRLRVVDVNANGASIALENGALYADVVPARDAAWRVIAGPFTVRVTGTRFDVRWSAAREHFTLTVSEGSVAVSGAFLGDERALRAGETLRVFVTEQRLELDRSNARSTPSDAAVPAPSAAPASPPSVDAEVSLDAAAPSRGRGESARNATAPAEPDEVPARDGWRELLGSGSLRKAFAAAEEAGFTQVCNTASAAELLQLGDGARLAGRPERAREALLSLRRRFPSDPRRAAAAFALGKVAFDQERAYRAAADWFATSVREQPGGSLAREASGRLIEALQRARDLPGARRAAQQYLDRYPTGPHAEVARSVLP